MKTSPEMQTIITKLGLKHGVDFTREGSYLRLDMKGYDRLSIEHIGANVISVAHYFEQEGDLVADPDIVFFTGYSQWVAITIQNQFGYVEAAIMLDDHRGLKNFYPKRQADIADFCKTWAKNIKAQGWLENATCTRRNTGDPVISVDVDLRAISPN